jgi:hypothetical protein
MDSNGNFYASEEVKEELAKAVGEKVGAMADAPQDSVEVDIDVAKALSKMNHQARRVFHSERRRGATAEAALSAAVNSLPVR